jgi:hypothetical protein
MSNDYTGETLDLEVARYGLRTFRHVAKSKVDYPEISWSSPWRSINNLSYMISPNYLYNPVTNNIELTAGEPAKDEPMVLASVIKGGSHWENGTCEATCLAEKDEDTELLDRMRELAALSRGETPVNNHIAPQENCHCGIYAAHTYQALYDQYPSACGNIVAVIAAEGQTIIGSKGFRTQYARVIAYWCKDELSGTAETQFKDAERFPDLDLMLKQYGFPDNGQSELERAYKTLNSSMDLLSTWFDQPKPPKTRPALLAPAIAATIAGLFFGICAMMLILAH